MAMLTVRNITDEVHRALRVRAAQRGHSMEAEVRDILDVCSQPAGTAEAGVAVGRHWQAGQAE